MRHARTLLLALLVTFLWGASFVLTKMALAKLGPLTIALYRWLIATLVFAIAFPLQGELPILRQALRQDFFPFVLLGLVGISAFYAFQNAALRFTTAVNVGLLINFCTIFIAVLGVLWLKERLGRWAILGIAFSFAGATLVSWPNRAIELESGHLLGDGLTLLAAGFDTLLLLPWAAWEGLALPRSALVWGRC